MLFALRRLSRNHHSAADFVEKATNQRRPRCQMSQTKACATEP